MPLSLQALDGSSETRALSGDPFTLGRGPENDWVIIDPDREVSKVHCRIEADAAGFVLVDQSINGIVIEGAGQAMGPGRTHRLADGDIFRIGRHRFKVSTGPDRAPLVPAGEPETDVQHILRGGSDAQERRAAGAVTGEADRWLGGLPKGAADEGMRQPLGWSAPPPTGAAILPDDFDQPSSDFADRDEHRPAVNVAMSMPEMRPVLPSDWLNEGGAAIASPARNNPMAAVRGPQAAASRSRPEAVSSGEARHAFEAGGRLDAAELAQTPDDVLFRSAGEAVRALLDGLDTLEAAQSVAEHDCGVAGGPDGGGAADFFAATRDPAAVLLSSEMGVEGLGRRIAALANRQRALGQAVAKAAALYNDAVSPSTIANEAGARFRIGPLGAAAAWRLFVRRHAEVVGQDEQSGGFLSLLRDQFDKMMRRA